MNFKNAILIQARVGSSRLRSKVLFKINGLSILEIGYKRLKKSKKMKKEIFEAILKSQTTDLVRKKKSDIVLLNNHSMKTYKHKLANLLTKLIQ